MVQRIIITTSILLSTLLVASNIYAERVQTSDDLCGIQDYDSLDPPNFGCSSPNEENLLPSISHPAAIPVHEGDTIEIPWDGALVHKDHMILLGLRITNLRSLRWTDRIYLKTKTNLELQHQRDVARLTEELITQQADANYNRAVRAERQASMASVWYKSVWFGIIVGVLTASIVMLAGAYLLSSL